MSFSLPMRPRVSPAPNQQLSPPRRSASSPSPASSPALLSPSGSLAPLYPSTNLFYAPLRSTDPPSLSQPHQQSYTPYTDDLSPTPTYTYTPSGPPDPSVYHYTVPLSDDNKPKSASTPTHEREPENPFGLAPGSLYVMVVSPTYQPLQGQTPVPMAKRWHWALYFQTTRTMGLWYHIRRVVPGPPGASVKNVPVFDWKRNNYPVVNNWRFEMLAVQNVLRTIPVICALRIAQIDNDMVEDLSQRMAQVRLRVQGIGIGLDGNDSVEEGLSSCRWVLDALYELDEEGWIAVGVEVAGRVEGVYNEAVEVAVRAELLDAPLVRDCQVVRL